MQEECQHQLKAQFSVKNVLSSFDIPELHGGSVGMWLAVADHCRGSVGTWLAVVDRSGGSRAETTLLTCTYPRSQPWAAGFASQETEASLTAAGLLPGGSASCGVSTS